MLNRRYGLEIWDGASNRGGIWACCAIKRDTVTLGRLAECEVEAVRELGFSFEDVFVSDTLVRWFDERLPENVLRAQAERETGEVCEKVELNPYLWENFYSHDAVRGMAAELRGMAALIRGGAIEDVPCKLARLYIAEGRYDPADVAGFYVKFAGRLERLTELDEREYIAAFWGP